MCRKTYKYRIAAQTKISLLRRSSVFLFCKSKKMSTAIILVSLLVTLLVTAYLYVKNTFSYWKRREIPYKEPSFPFGNLTDLFMGKKSIGEVIQDLYNGTTEPFFGIFSTLQPGLLIQRFSKFSYTRMASQCRCRSNGG